MQDCASVFLFYFISINHMSKGILLKTEIKMGEQEKYDCRENVFKICNYILLRGPALRFAGAIIAGQHPLDNAFDRRAVFFVALFYQRIQQGVSLEKRDHGSLCHHHHRISCRNRRKSPPGVEGLGLFCIQIQSAGSNMSAFFTAVVLCQYRGSRSQWISP